MKKIIMNKLRSEKGASITFALLLFLVCTVLCSVILAAATAAAGRMSRIAENDQRYYSVTSAAGLMKDILDGKSVSVVELKKTERTTVYTYGQMVSDTPGTSTSTVYITADNKAGDIDFDGDVIKVPDGTTYEAVGSSVDRNSIHKDAACNITINSDGTYSIAELNKTFKLESDVDAGITYDALAATITEKMGTNGDLTFNIYNTFNSTGGPSGAGSKFTAQMVFGADVSVTRKSETENVSSTPSTGGTVTVVANDRELNIVTITWNLREIRYISDTAGTP